MIANYHTHTPRCCHASGTEEEYVRCALQAGMETLGFSDHAPYLFPEGFRSPFRMLPEELEDYVLSVERVRKQYAGKIAILLGAEAEFYPKYFADTVSMLKDQGIEYLILGQHMLYNEVEGIGTAGPTTDVMLLRQYCDQVIDGIYTGKFTYFAHPDIMNFVGAPEDYRQQMSRICRAAKACRMPLEINLLGLQLQRQYPNPVFWELAAEEGCQVVLGVDAHRPEALLDHKLEENGRQLAQRYGLEVLETVQMVRI